MRYKYLAASVLIALLATPVSAQSVRAGTEAWAKADYDAAVAIWRPLAEKGDADAQFNLGQAYRWGRGVPLNLAAAQAWYERAAQKGQLDSQVILGLMLFQNGDHTGGLRWLKLASDKGEPRAMLVYGTALFNGDGVAQDPILGYAFVSRAAAQGLPAAKETLAQLDQVMPLADRRKGAALAVAKAKAAPAPGSKPAKTKPPQTAAAKPAAPPASKPAAAAPAAAPSGSWRIQLGAFSQHGNAEALYRKVSGNGALAGRKPIYVAAGAVTRLQVGPFESKAAAESACKALGVPCFAVPGK